VNARVAATKESNMLWGRCDGEGLRLVSIILCSSKPVRSSG